MYLSYAEYTAYGGTLDETTFNDLEFQAEATINYYTFNRLIKDTEFSDSVKRLTKYLIDLYKKKADSLSLGGSESSATGAYITSQSNDGVSVSYSGMPAVNLYEMCKDDAKNAVNLYLNGVMNRAGRKLLYRGLYCGE